MEDEVNQISKTLSQLQIQRNQCMSELKEIDDKILFKKNNRKKVECDLMKNQMVHEQNESLKKEKLQQFKILVEIEKKPNKKQNYPQNVVDNALELLSLGVSKADIHRATGIQERTLLRWQNSNGKKKKRGGKKIQSMEHEKKVLQFVEECIGKQIKLSAKRLILYAKGVARELNLPLKCSRRWFKLFRRRNNLVIRRITSKGRDKISDSQEKVIKYNFINSFQKRFLNDNTYPPQHILNFDEIGIGVEMPGKTTIAKKGQKRVKVKTGGKEKKQYSFGITTTITGELLPGVFIYDSQGKRNRVQVKGRYLKVQYRPQGSWYDEKQFIQTIKNVIYPHLKNIPLKEHERGVLLMDPATFHKTPTVKKVLSDVKYDFSLLPSGSSSFLQPNDICLNKEIKAKYGNIYENEMSEFLMKNKSPKFDKNTFANHIESILSTMDQRSIQAGWFTYLDDIPQEYNEKDDWEDCSDVNEQELEEINRQHGYEYSDQCFVVKEENGGKMEEEKVEESKDQSSMESIHSSDFTEDSSSSEEEDEFISQSDISSNSKDFESDQLSYNTMEDEYSPNTSKMYIHE